MEVTRILAEHVVASRTRTFRPRCGMKLLGLSARQMTWALGIAATQAAGVREMFGSMCKHDARQFVTPAPGRGPGGSAPACEPVLDPGLRQNDVCGRFRIKLLSPDFSQEKYCMKRHAVMLTAALISTGTTSALAQNYPTRPIRLVVASSPGGASDILARTLAQKMTEDLGQQVVVDNRGGASGVIGTDIVAKAVPDGYTLLIIQPSLTINPSMIRKLPYDTIKDFTPVSLVVDAAQIMTCNPSVAAKSVKELIALAKAKPGTLNFGSPGVGTSPHLTAELFKLQAGVDMPQVLFKGSGPAFISLISGEVQVKLSTVISAMPHVKSGKVRALGVTTKKRVAIFPDVPTIAESALPEFDTSQWFGILGPARLPPAIVKRLNTSLSRATADPQVKERLVGQGVEVVNSTPEEFAAVIKRELTQWAKVIKAAGIQPQ
jgi:tripartite-type tricarboxylate transporter receptor subunit TctC